jgi:hypothetical protein
MFLLYTFRVLGIPLSLCLLVSSLLIKEESKSFWSKRKPGTLIVTQLKNISADSLIANSSFELYKSSLLFFQLMNYLAEGLSAMITYNRIFLICVQEGAGKVAIASFWC